MSKPAGDIDPKLAEVFAYVDDHRQEFLDRLFDYVRRPSISAQGEGIAEVADYIAEVMRSIGLESEIVPTAGWPMVVGRWSGAPGKPTVMLYGHYDVQPPDPIDEWVSPPFEPTIRDGRVYARGVGDNKGQHLAQLMALESLFAVQGTLPCNVIVWLEGEEEVGSPQMPIFAAENKDKLNADLVITADGLVDQSGRSRVTFGNRGVVHFDLVATGANRDLHSGNFGGVAPNPIWTLVHLLGTMKNDKGEITIDGFYDDYLPLTEKEQEAIGRLPADVEAIKSRLGLKEFDVPVDRGYHERLVGWPTFTINGFHSGYGGPGSKTVLPHEALVKCDIRLVERMSADDIFAKVEDHVKRHAPEVKVVRHGSMDPSKTPIESPYTEPVRRALALVRGEEPLLVPSSGGSLPTYVFTRVLGLHAFNVPYGNPDENNHAPNENLEIARFYDGIKTGAAILTFIGQV